MVYGRVTTDASVLSQVVRDVEEELLQTKTLYDSVWFNVR
jgi:hypothetical protein